MEIPPDLCIQGFGLLDILTLHKDILNAVGRGSPSRFGSLRIWETAYVGAHSAFMSTGGI